MDFGISDILKDAYGEYKARVKYRFVTSYLYSFILWNLGKLLVLGFSERPIEDRVTLFAHELGQYWGCGYWVPFVISAAWIYLVPLANYFIEIARMKMNVKFEEKLSLEIKRREEFTSNILFAEERDKNKANAAHIENLELRLSKLFLRVNAYLVERKSFEKANQGVSNEWVKFAGEVPNVYGGKDDISKVIVRIKEFAGRYEKMSTSYLEEDIKSSISQMRGIYSRIDLNGASIIDGANDVECSNVVNEFISALNELNGKVNSFKPALNSQQLLLGNEYEKYI